jgi:hypothetical protein
VARLIVAIDHSTFNGASAPRGHSEQISHWSGYAGVTAVTVIRNFFDSREPQLRPLAVIVNARVQVRLGAIDARAKLAPKRATRKQGNDPSLPQVQ